MTRTNLIAEPGKQELIITRIFDAPREFVFKTYTDPDLVPQWWGPKNLTTTVNKMDVRPGGVWRFVQRDAHGNEYAFNGVYHQILPPERLVYTFEFEGMPGHVLLETVTFEEFEARRSLRTNLSSRRLRIAMGCSSRGWRKGRPRPWIVSPRNWRRHEFSREIVVRSAIVNTEDTESIRT